LGPNCAAKAVIHGANDAATTVHATTSESLSSTTTPIEKWGTKPFMSFII